MFFMYHTWYLMFYKIILHLILKTNLSGAYYSHFVEEEIDNEGWPVYKGQSQNLNMAVWFQHPCSSHVRYTNATIFQNSPMIYPSSQSLKVTSTYTFVAFRAQSSLLSATTMGLLVLDCWFSLHWPSDHCGGY